VLGSSVTAPVTSAPSCRGAAPSEEIHVLTEKLLSPEAAFFVLAGPDVIEDEVRPGQTLDFA
jgi:hypothetical protein